MLRLMLSFTVVMAIAIILSSPASATTITIGASKDATIYQNNVNNSNGAGPGMFAGTNVMNSPRRGLLEFDIAGNVPAGSTITNVQLTLSLGLVAGSMGVPGQGDQTPRTIGLFKLTNDWGEGTTGSSFSVINDTGNGFSANAGDATWNARFFSGTLWTTPGGDHNAIPSASTSVGSTFNAPFTWLSTSALVADVQGWLDAPATDFGWELINAQETTPTDFRAFFTREASDPTRRPELQITFAAPVPEPGGLVLFSLGILGLIPVIRRMKRPVV